MNPLTQTEDSNRNATTRHPEETVLYRYVQTHLETFLSEAESRDAHIPNYVVSELYRFLDCGTFARGFVRLYCDSCRKDKLVAFSCKGRGFCPSCGARRMNETSAHLIDRVFPHVPYRQWVLSLPRHVRYKLAYDKKLLSRVLSVFIRAVSAYQRKKARLMGLKNPKTGAFTAIQRFGSGLNLNVHFHTIFMDGVYANPPNSKEFIFFKLPPPTSEELVLIIKKIKKRIDRLMKNGTDEIEESEPFQQILGASVMSKALFSGRKNKVPERLGAWIPRQHQYQGGSKQIPHCALYYGYSLHAGTAHKAKRRDKLERLCRYILRPPIAKERLELDSAKQGKITYRLKRTYSDGTEAISFSPMEFVERITALIPPPRGNIVRYHGLFAPNSKLRPKIVPVFKDEAKRQGMPLTKAQKTKWAELKKRTFGIDALKCECGKKLRQIAVIKDPKVIRAILQAKGLNPKAPEIHPARAPPALPVDEEYFQ